jgi:hypothetical protein
MMDTYKNPDIIILGIDPYPDKDKRSEIAFATKTIKQLKAKNNSGRYLLYSLGIDIDEKDYEKASPESLFESLYKNDGILTLNACLSNLKNLNSKSRKDAICNSEKKNSNLLKDAKIIFASKSSLKVLKQYLIYPEIKYKINVTIHPSFRNHMKKEWQDLYSSEFTRSGELKRRIKKYENPTNNL